MQVVDLCGLWVMEKRWISPLVNGRASPPVLRALFSIFRVKICRYGVQVVVAAPHAIRSSRLQPHLGGNVERLVGVVWSSRISSGYGDLHIIKELHRQFFLLLRQADSGRSDRVARRRHGLEVEDEGLLKDLVVSLLLIC
jgi:hypothetical protein